ncbi:MAG: hypothetical protein HY928_02005 [Elusimicrobia bacterium]|nr:hypothetical protein [Elusimicrobiota bacterium]
MAFLAAMAAFGAAAPAGGGLDLKPFRTYSDFEADEYGEGSGYTIWLWKEGEKLRGFLTYKEGSPDASGNIGELEKVEFDPKTGALSFSSRVEACGNAGEGFKFLPVASYAFKGKLSGKSASGVLKATYPDSEDGVKRMKVSLPLQSSDSSALFRAYPSWERLMAAWHHCP